MPMERDFDESVIPSIQAAYNGGVMGTGAGLSGAQAETTARQTRGLKEKEADLRYQERNNAISRNMADREFQSNVGANKFNAQTMAPQVRSGNAASQFNAANDTIAANLAARQSMSQTIANLGSTVQSGFNAYQSSQNTNRLLDIMEQRIVTPAEVGK
jgi:hypothetical protein